jgi:hypothetical protein
MKRIVLFIIILNLLNAEQVVEMTKNEISHSEMIVFNN